MSAMLDQLLDADRLADIANHEAAMEVPGPLRLFLVSIGSRQPFEVMARHSVDVVTQHIDLAEEGERIEVRQKVTPERLRQFEDARELMGVER